MLPADLLLDLLPFDAEGRVGQHVVKGPARMAVLRQGIAEGDVGNILTLDQHVSLTDGVGFRVQLLARHGQLGGGVEFLQVLFGHRQHAARSSGGVIDGAHHARSANLRISSSKMEPIWLDETRSGCRSTPANFWAT